jgi:hypothetical protein
MEEDSPDMICMFNGISSMDDSPKLDWYNDDYTTLDFSKKSTTYDWEEEDHLQSQQDNQSVHGNYDSNDQSAENLRVSGNTLPLCFSSFQFLRENCKQVVNSREGECSDQLGEDAIVDMEVVLNPELQPSTYFDFQIPDESLKPEINYELIQNNSVPLCFNSFQFLKKNLEYMLKDKHTENQEVSVEPMQQSFQFLQDPISDVLDDLCCQSHFPSSNYGMKNCYDIDMIRQSTSLSFSAEVTLQSPSEHLQPCQEVHEDANSITTTSNHEVELVKFEYPVIGQFYLDPSSYLYGEIFHQNTH